MEKLKIIIDRIEPNNMMKLLNAVYFKNIRKNVPKNTKKNSFCNVGDKSNETLVDMINTKKTFKYYEEATLQIIPRKSRFNFT